jgi:hypothetical protein
VRLTKHRKVRKDKGVRKLRNLDKTLGLNDVQLGQIRADEPVTTTETVKG